VPACDLVLVRWREEDLDLLLAVLSGTIEHLRTWMPWASRNERESVAQFLAVGEAGWRRGDRFEYSIRDRRRKVLGSAGLMRRIAPGGLELGYWVHVDHTRRGVATRAAAALTQTAFDLGDVDHVEIHHDEANIASGRVPARLGFRNLGTRPVRPQAPGEVGREVRWRLDSREFPASAAGALLTRASGKGP
jgi:ribosomal-protein-serine acetyltransferase